MKNVKFSRRSFLKAGAAASVASLVAANAAVASAAEPKAAAQENGLFDGMFGGKTPKYIFLFIGDGMSYPQIQSTNYYLSALENGTSMGGDGAVLQHENALSFVDFPVAGSAQTYDSTSFCPDSASTATSISTGHKTYSGTINMDETGTVAYETISEKLKAQNKPYAVSLSQKPASIQGGMILAEGNIETNLSYEILIKNMRDELEAEVAKVLTE